MKRFVLWRFGCYKLQRRNLGGLKRPGHRAPHQSGLPKMFMCLAICVTCACHLVIISEENLFVDAITDRADGSISLYLIITRIGSLKLCQFWYLKLVK